MLSWYTILVFIAYNNYSKKRTFIFPYLWRYRKDSIVNIMQISDVFHVYPINF